MRFIADIMLGKLARYLRMAGYDVLYKNDAADDEIIETAKRSKRIVLTRDSLMLERRVFKTGALRSVFIKYDFLIDQLRQMRSALGLSLNPDLSRCVACNGLLAGIRTCVLSPAGLSVFSRWKPMIPPKKRASTQGIKMSAVKYTGSNLISWRILPAISI